MPEYLAPGVFVEETSFRSKSIEGVPTSTTGFAGMAAYGPVRYTGGPSSTEPACHQLHRVRTRLRRTRSASPSEPAPPVTRENYLAHAARAFFANGGKRLYVSRVFAPTKTHPDNPSGVASTTVAFSGGGDVAHWRARWPGSYGNVLVVGASVRRRDSTWQHPTFGTQARGLGRGAVVEITAAAPPAFRPRRTSTEATSRSSTSTTAAEQRFIDRGIPVVGVNAGDVIKEVMLQVQVYAPGARIDVYNELATHPAQRRWIGRILERRRPRGRERVVWLDTIRRRRPRQRQHPGPGRRTHGRAADPVPADDAPLGEPHRACDSATATTARWPPRQLLGAPRIPMTCRP
jgi:uncharacterized protein